MGYAAHGGMLHPVYTMFSVYSHSLHGEMERDDFTLYFAVMLELWTSKRDGG